MSYSVASTPIRTINRGKGYTSGRSSDRVNPNRNPTAFSFKLFYAIMFEQFVEHCWRKKEARAFY
jgi:hypothetical protein